VKFLFADLTRGLNLCPFHLAVGVPLLLLTEFSMHWGHLLKEKMEGFSWKKFLLGFQMKAHVEVSPFPKVSLFGQYSRASS